MSRVSAWPPIWILMAAPLVFSFASTLGAEMAKIATRAIVRAAARSARIATSSLYGATTETTPA